MTLSGGLRSRNVKKSVYEFLNDALTTIGWFNSGRNHLPVAFLPDRPDFSSDVTVPLNTCAIFLNKVASEDLELGSYSGQYCYHFCFDLYAQDDHVGLALIQDVHTVLAGRFPGVNLEPVIVLKDWTQDPVVDVSFMDVCGIEEQHPDGNQTWQKYWFKVNFCVIDYDYQF